MSEHRRKPPQSRGRRAAQPPSGGRRAAQPPHEITPSSHGMPSDRPHGGRAEARRAAQRAAGGRRRAASGATAVGGRRARYEPEKKRFIDYPRAGKDGWRRWAPSWKLIAALCLAFLGALVGLAGLGLAMVEVPSEKNALAIQESNVYYWKDGSVMAQVGDKNRQNVNIEDIPRSMQDAVVSAENATFWEDSGIDPMGIARAAFNMARGGDTQSGSTITQQFVKNTYLTQEQTISRKVRELLISIKVNADMEKEEILQGYLNTSYYGRGAYGVEAAAQAYFGKSAEDLTTPESALLTTVLKGPDLYDPAGGEKTSAADNTERAKKRWNWVLDRMVELGKLDKAERDGYEFPKLKPRKPLAGQNGQVGYMVSIAGAEVRKKLGLSQELFDQGGYQIHTTFEKDKVTALTKAVDKVRKQYLKPEERPGGKDKHVQFGAASVEPGTGRIVAIYGGPGFDKGHFTNNADTQGVPVGSTWKPFVLSAAMEYGTYKSGGEGISPESVYNGDNKLKIKRQDGTDYLDKEGNPFYQVNNADEDHGPVTLRKAMEVSANTPFVQLGMDVGMDKVKAMAKKAGIDEDSFDPNLNPSFALGTSTPGAIEMAEAYATFAKSGIHVEPYAVTKVMKEGEEKEGFEKPHRETALDANIANNITDILHRNVVNGPEGTGHRAQQLGRPAAGKTGTTDQNKSAWWVGYTPQLSTAVTMFRSDPTEGTLLSMNGTGGFKSIHGGELPTQVWVDYMKAALKGKPVESFPRALPIGKKADGLGIPSASPSVSETPDPTPTESETTEPSTEPSSSAPTPSTQPSDTCRPGEWFCQDNEGQTEGNTNGADQGQTEGNTGGEDDEGQTEGNTGGDAQGNTGGRPGGGDNGSIWGMNGN
ncbi:transglycosylase domain-containing protein [Streptomyces glaucosporus]|uniref:Transglycosylase domain-containing protein n=1 Tax=Streptomyces glaucosporus TaxID=284044 RepID=A0ABN3HPG2_9ACTN